MVLTLLQQVLTMFLLSFVGYLLFKGGKLTLEGSKNLGNILINVSLPCVIVQSFMSERTPEKTAGLLWSALAAALILGISMAVSAFVFKKDAIGAFAAAFSNPGFFGIPLITAAFGTGAVFYVAAYIAFLNLLQWTWGVSMITGNKTGLKLKNVVRAPFLIAIAIGLVLFFTGIPVPGPVRSCVSFLAGLNTPLAMFTIGVYLAQCDLLAMFRRSVLYKISAVRLLLVPVLAAVLLLVLPGTAEMKTSILIAAACPVGSNVAVYAQLHDKDYPYAVQTVIISTLLCVVTIPLLVGIMERFF